MLNKQAEHAVANASFLKSFCRPLYDSYCFSNIPNTIRKLFGLPHQIALPNDTIPSIQTPYEQVVVLFIDSFGWNYFNRFSHLPFLNRFVEQGIVNKITSQFPSTTAPHVTCIHTGVSVGQSGIYEWFYYEPIVDAPIAPLLFSYAKDKTKNTLKASGFNPADIFPQRTLYHEFKEHEIDSFLFFPKDTARSAFSTVVLDGAKTTSYGALNQGLTKLIDSITACKGKKAYHLLYYSEIDTKGHFYGPNDAQVEEEITQCFNTLETVLWPALQNIPNTALLLFADHGMTPVDPSKTVFLNKDFPGFEQYIRKNKKGVPIVPCGSCRDMFLHIERESVHRVYQMLKTHLQGKAEVFHTHELVEEGFFGKSPLIKNFSERIGDLVTIPLADNTVWWHREGDKEFPYHGYHGGLTRDEMETTFLILES